MLAERGHEGARAALEPPPIPDGAAYLIGYARRLHGRSGCSMAGLLPLSWRELDAFCRLMRVRLSQWEIDVLMLLDAVLLNPTAGPVGPEVPGGLKRKVVLRNPSRKD